MKATADSWLIPQIQRLSRSRPERLGSLVSRLKYDSPDLYAELALSAVEHGDMSHAECAEALGILPLEVDQRLENFRTELSEAVDDHLVVRDSGQAAKVRGHMITVWEVVREFRRVGTVQNIKTSFPSLTEIEIRSALCYAGRHPDEIGGQISRYEEMASLAKEAYPFAVVTNSSVSDAS